MTKPIDRERLISLLKNISSPIARKVLLVDDDEIMRESVRRVLEAGEMAGRGGEQWPLRAGTSRRIVSRRNA